MPLPAALLLLDIYPLRRVAAVGWRTLLVEKIPYLMLGGATGVIAFIAQSQAHALDPYQRYGIGSRLGMVGYSIMFYPWKFLWSANLSPLYELPGTVDPLAPRFLLSTIGLLAVTSVMVALRRWWPAALAAWTYSLLLVLPVSGIVHAGVQLVADRYSYLSGLGFALLASAALVWALEPRRALKRSVVSACVLGAVLVIITLAAATWRQTKIWRDTETLWSHALRLDPQNARAHYYLGDWFNGTGRPREALAEFRRALALADRDDLKSAARNGVGSALNGVAASLNNEGIVRAERGDLQATLSLFLQAARVVPGYPDACRNLRQLAGMTRVDPQDLSSCHAAAGSEIDPARSPPSSR